MSDRICTNPDCRSYADGDRCPVCGSPALAPGVTPAREWRALAETSGDHTNDDLIAAVEEHWYARTKGELFLGTVDEPEMQDRDLTQIVLALATYQREQADDL